MKNSLKLFTLVILFITLTGCGSTVFTTNDQNGNAKSKFRHGYTSMKDWDTFRLQQENNNNRLLIEKEIGIALAGISKALKEKDKVALEHWKSIKSYWVSQKESLQNQSNGAEFQKHFTVDVKIRNFYDQPVVIKDTLFEGATLGINKTTEESHPFKLGLNYVNIWTIDGRGKYRQFKIKRVITKNTKYITIRKGKVPG